MYFRRRFRVLRVLAVVACLAEGELAVPAAHESSANGALESVDANGIVSGWALDSSDPTHAISVHAYLDGPAGGGGTFVGAVPANIPRPAPVAGANGFRLPLPSPLWDGRPHRLYVYAIAQSGNVVLPGSPQTFLLNPTVIRIDNGVLRVGVEPRCGGTVVELSIGGRNLVNNADCTGRQVQAALYDGNSAYDNCYGCQGVWGWDPVQGGDVHNFGSPVLASSVTPRSVYVATRPNEWYPDNKGGGPGRPVPSDVVIEQTLSFVPNAPYAVQLHYRIAHLGGDTHAVALQEFPAVWVNQEFDRFITYAGMRPWTGDAVTVDRLNAPDQPALQRRVSERWASVVDQQGLGLTVFVPQQYPYAVGFKFEGTAGEYGFGANYFRPHMPFSFGPGTVLEGDVYLIAGDYRQARADLKALHDAGYAWPDILPPFGSLDLPSANQSVSGVVHVAGWMFDNGEVARVDVLVDGAPVGTAAYGVSRPDVATVFPHAPERVGFEYRLDCGRLTSGPHRVSVRAVDQSGNVTELPAKAITVGGGSD